jgi:hypothetical protein
MVAHFPSASVNALVICPDTSAKCASSGLLGPLRTVTKGPRPVPNTAATGIHVFPRAYGQSTRYLGHPEQGFAIVRE